MPLGQMIGLDVIGEARDIALYLPQTLYSLFTFRVFSLGCAYILGPSKLSRTKYIYSSRFRGDAF